MEQPNKKRILVQIIKELSVEMQITVKFFCYDWVIQLTYLGSTKYIFGYDWELNSTTSQLIAKDKSACYEILKSHGLPAIEHILFLSPEFQSYTGGFGNWENLIQYAKKYNYQIVCKSNIGSGGNKVFKINNQTELESCVQLLFGTQRALCASPFCNIENEYRVILLEQQPQLIYKKQRPFIIGNGRDTIFTLINTTFNNANLKEFDFYSLVMNDILPEGEVVHLHWQHNLGKGAKAILVQDKRLKDGIISLAIKAAKAIGITFASVDIAEVEGKMYILEINSGIMMEGFAQQGEKQFALAMNIFRKALIKMMSIDLVPET